MERGVSHSQLNDQKSVSSADWEKLKEEVTNAGGKIIQIGILDDIDPNGGADTACQRSLDEAVGSGRIITVNTEILPGVNEVQTFRIIEPINKV